MRRLFFLAGAVLGLLFVATSARADVGDPQVGTNHPWYPGELSCSTFERLFATQSELYQRVVGSKPTTDEQKVLASWLWRNTHYWHSEEGMEDLWGKGFHAGLDMRGREYWTGLFSHGFGLCGTTHAQWVAEMEALLGHGRARVSGVDGHNSFEVYLRGGAYGEGKWVLLDHDLSTIVFDPQGKALHSIAEIQPDWKRLTSRQFAPERQHGWLPCGLSANDAGVYRQFNTVEYLAGYAGPPPRIHLRRGESLRRYLQPGLDDGKTYVFWGRNDATDGILGPERSLTWVNQPERMYRSSSGTPYQPGQARYANAVFTFKPDFASENWREATVEADNQHIVFEFQSPYVIAATPTSNKTWAIYDKGCRNGLVLKGDAHCSVSVSTDHGKNWADCGTFADGMDLTDLVKGSRQYWLRLKTGPKELAGSGLTTVTVCQASAATMPHLKDDGSEVRFLASGQAVVSAGPNVPQATAHLVAGQLGTPKVTLAMAPPAGKRAIAVDVAAHVLSSNPPSPEIKYQIELSLDGGITWQAAVKDWTIPRVGQEPKDFWSQSLCWGHVDLKEPQSGPIQARFHNDGGKCYARCEAHLTYQTGMDRTKVTFAWKDDQGTHQSSHEFRSQAQRESWKLPTGRNVKTSWVEFANGSK